GSVFYVLSAPVIQRMYYHTALGAQFIITASLVLWVYDDLIGSDRRRMVYWGLMGFLCVAIHSYFLPMAGMILAALAVIQIKKKKAALAAGEFAAFSAAGLANLYVLGAFYGGTDASGPGLGTFNSNLNTFVNPWEIGRLLPALPLENDFQYEGMAYLGAGILLLFAVVAAGIVIRRIRKVPEEAFFSDRIYGRVTVLLTAVSFAAAVLPNISFGSIKILWIPYPRFVERLLGIFRSNGRLVWPAMYILMTAAISFTAYTFRRYRGVAVMIVAAALALQITDMSRTFAGKYELYMSDHPTDTVWDDEEVSEFIKGKREFIFLYTDNDITMQTAYYGYFHGMRQNNYYYARDIEDKVADTIRLYYLELDEGNIRDDAVYIIKSEDYNKDSRYYDSMDCERMERFGHVIFKAQKKDHGMP
ncbi:MAG: DUF6311 domain-containing protein, partial [Lachnospiraceae bacterium]|nr:DUF6311 domain-containing protein [Lachnospiraceae bacterium]